MKTVLVTITSGDKYRELGKITHPTLLAYATKIGAEFLVWRDTKKHKFPAYKKLDISKLLEKYDRVLYVDTDILIRDDAPNLFDIVPETHVGLFEEGQFMNRQEAMRQLSPNEMEWITRGTYYNTGVMVVSKAHASMFTRPAVETYNFMEQTWLNLILFKTEHPVHHLPYKFNRMVWMDACGENRLDSYFLHYAGILSNDVDNISTVKEDLAQWEKDRETGYKYPRKIHFTVRGGFGDQVAAEPVLRYVKETIFKNDRVMVHADFHELFEHLDVELFHFGNIIRDPGIFKLDLTPKVDSSGANFSLMHQTDFASIKAFGGLLPHEKKILAIKDFSKHAPEGIDRDTVLIHASKWWPTKTFPLEFWATVAEEAKTLGLKPIFIGKTGEKDGPAAMAPEGFDSLIDKTDVKGLIGAIQACGFLVTTDSAPLHIAGSSSCRIGLVSPIRVPWSLVPTRSRDLPETTILCQGTPWTQADFSPNSVESVRLDDPKFLPGLMASLPTREQIRAFLTKV